MNNQTLTSSAPVVNDPISEYRKHQKRQRLVGAGLTLLATLGCLGLIFGCYLTWDILAANGKLWVLPLFTASFCFLLFVVHLLGRTADPVWIEKLSDVRGIAESRMSN